MAKELDKMRSIRVTRIGIKAALANAEWQASSHRNVIHENWDKEDVAESRKALNKSHKRLAHWRSIINECQRQLRETKHSLKALNRQYDYRIKATTPNTH